MQKGSLFRKVILTTWFQAAIPAIVIILLLPVLGSRYSFEVETANAPGDNVYYSDLNSDRFSEKLILGKGVPYFFISVYNLHNQIFDQWNLPGKIDPIISELFTGNYDDDNFEEIYIFTRTEDSLFLNVNEIIQPSGTKMERIFITKIGFVNNEVTSFLAPLGFFDENGDGIKEFYFSIATAFTQQPRKIYFYDLVNNKLTSSQYTASICLIPEMRDVDGDNRPEIFGLSSASGNYKADVPFSDSSAWFMVFDDHLEFKLPPVEFPGFANSIETKAYNSEGGKRIILSYWRGGTDTSLLNSQILIYNSKGQLLRNSLTSDFGFTSVIQPFVIENSKSDRVYLIGNILMEIDDNLEVIKKIDLPYTTRYYYYKYDLNHDGEDEIIIHYYDENMVVIYNSNLQELISKEIYIPQSKWRFNAVLNGVNKPMTFMQAGTLRYFLNFEKNNYYYLMYLSFIGVYFLLYFFILLIKRFNTFQVVEKEGLKQRLASLQLQGIKSQLDPHFTFNTLNSIASLIYLEDRQVAYDYMNKFTQLLRVMLNDAERLYRSLGEEIDFVTTYLELEKLRFGDKFNYIIDISHGVTLKEQVPKLVLQTFAENAIKHGLMPCAEGGKLKIIALREGDYLTLTIEDNGIGREKSIGRSTSTGKGLKLTGEFYEILNQMNDRSITHSVIDLYNVKGESVGTRVIVMVPIEPLIK